MWQFTHEEIIDAPVEAVFKIIADLQNYPNWNPFLKSANGRVEVGGVISGKSVLGRYTTSYRHKIFEYIPNKSLCWQDFGFMALFVHSRRSRFTEARDGKTYYKCHLSMTGPLVWFVNMMYGKGLRDGIVAEANATKELAEKMSKK